MKNEFDQRNQPYDVNRRDFLRGTSIATVLTLMGGIPIRAAESKPSEDLTNYKAEAAPVNCGLIGCGKWGREILTTLAQLPNAPVVGVAEHYPAFLRRAKEWAPKAQFYPDYKKLLENKEVQAVIVATPTHQHRDIVLAALEAGKHVYCEVPLAHTIEDARTIAQAAAKTHKLNFQVGLQSRSDPQFHHLSTFIRTGVMGKTILARAQSHKKQTWRQASPNPEREKEINWRLEKEISTGMVGEIGIHPIDLVLWYMLSRPTSVSGFGSLQHHTDGRDLPDTAQVTFEFSTGSLFNYTSTLANSFDSEYSLLYGTDSTVMVRDRRAWMFKETDAPLLGWEVYARKEAFYKESGIVLGANATKLTAQDQKPTDKPAADEKSSLYFALEAFVNNSNLISTGVEDFASTFNVNDTAALKEYLGSLAKSKLPAAGYKEGYEATVTVIKAHEAVLKGQKVSLAKDLFELA